MWLVALTTALVLMLAIGFALQQQGNRTNETPDIPPLPTLPA
jgi:hypothetical protein